MNELICIIGEYSYIQGEGNYWVSSPNVSSSSNFFLFLLLIIFTLFYLSQRLGVNIPPRPPI